METKVRELTVEAEKLEKVRKDERKEKTEHYPTQLAHEAESINLVISFSLPLCGKRPSSMNGLLSSFNVQGCVCQNGRMAQIRLQKTIASKLGFVLKRS